MIQNYLNRDTPEQYKQVCAFDSIYNPEEQSYKWLQLGSAACNALKSVVLDKRLLSDIPHLTELKHSGNLEVCHSLMLKYCTNHYLSLLMVFTRGAVLAHNSGIAGKNI